MRLDRRLQSMLLAVVGGLIGGFTSEHLLHPGAASAQSSAARTLTAKKFQLIDDDGQLRGYFSAEADGTTLLTMADRKGRPRVGVAVKPDGSPSVNVYGVGGAQQVTLGVAEDVAGLVVRTDKNESAFLGILNGKVGVEVHGSGGKRLWGAP